MSVQFGRWNLDASPVDKSYLARVRSSLSRHGPDSDSCWLNGNVAILYLAFHTTKESHSEVQPRAISSGEIITWDGRLDNRGELIYKLGSLLPTSSTDIEIVAAAYERWGTDCFCKLLGDWALAIWSQTQRRLILARDYIGTRPLYYSADQNQITWSTILHPLILLAGRTFTISEEYIAGWLSFYPATHLTPYVGVQSVPPASFVVLGPGQHKTQRYWDFDPAKRVCYADDGEYEEHFRIAFREAVGRRLRTDHTVIAELSGGMDSSAIVSIADQIIGARTTETPRLETVSFYNESEPNWNELSYLSKVEEKRGRTGLHIQVTWQDLFDFDWENGEFRSTPASRSPRANGPSGLLARYVDAQCARVVLSGIGGDEVLGGVPTPIPELQDLLTRLRLRILARQLKLWALEKRVPWFHLLFEALRGFIPSTLVPFPESRRPAPWLDKGFVKRNKKVFGGYESSLDVFGALPSFQANLQTLNHLRRQLNCSTTVHHPHLEKRYPYLDRDFLEFVYAIPRSQLLRPGRRRSLMRRALRGIVPEEILERKRKGFVARTPLVAISSEWSSLSQLIHRANISSLRIVGADDFLAAMRKAKENDEVPLTHLLRTISLETWFRNISHCGIVSDVQKQLGNTSECWAQN